ncbi:hypothetical protein XA26_49270 [Mycolicibacterium fortuitum]|uniref:Uncharacterized protein n=1 Tax=Mycolicibacterium fortuitum TaxID=1766 RepID=A0A0N9XKX5_MYCFO|nr:Formate dehydrogenase-O, major subunit [Mycobacterium sp. VKM Ac-1817D]ALI28722.1 hypothetical protein XA26_49270 [Mycolicibacterium fortuitum]
MPESPRHQGTSVDSDRLLTASSGRPMADGSELDPLSGTAVLNGIPVQICTAPMRGDFDG